VRAIDGLDDGGVRASAAGVRATDEFDEGGVGVSAAGGVGVSAAGVRATDEEDVGVSAAGVRAIDGPDEDGVGVSATGADEASGLDGGASSDGDGVRATDADGGRGDRRRAIVGSETGAGSSAGVRAIEAGPGVGDVSAVRPTDGGDTAGDGALGAWAGVRATDAGASAGGRVDRRRGVDGSSSAGVREMPSSSALTGAPVPAPSTMRAPRERSRPPRAMKRATRCSFDGSGIFSAWAIETRSELAACWSPNIHCAAKSLMLVGTQSGRMKPVSPGTGPAGASAAEGGAGADGADDGGAGGGGGAVDAERERRVAASRCLGRCDSATSRASARPP